MLLLCTTSLLFIKCAIQAVKRNKFVATFLMTGLGITSILHHGDIVPSIRKLDFILAHVCGAWGFIQGIRLSCWNLIPIGLWSPIAFYTIECITAPSCSYLIHASIHVTSSFGFSKVIALL